jgi:type II secretory pathway pseudopilin PulG
MLRRNKGFTLTEFAVGLLLFAVVTGMFLPSMGCLPNFMKARNKAREAEIKSNIHSIQISLERYAVDSGGVYPAFLIGAEAEYNVLRVQYESRYSTAAKVYNGATPFAKSANAPSSKEYCQITMDPLIQFSYRADYPVNPFAKRDSGMWNASYIGGTEMTGRFPYGGLHGDKMFDLGFGWGDTPQTDFVLYTTESFEESDDDGVRIFADPDLDAPGNFYYHPMFADMLPVYVHYVANYNAVYGPKTSSGQMFSAYGITGDEAVGYYLYGYGQSGDRDSNIEKGLDIFNRMPGDKFVRITDLLDDFGMPGLMELDSSVSQNQTRVETTGYPSAEYDPWTAGYPDGIDPTNPQKAHKKSGSDGILDWVIIEVTGGFDFRTDTVRDTYTYGGR